MSRPVKLHVYDLSGGMARALSMSLLGQQIEGIWHTGIVIDGIEYFYGGGIQRCPASQSPFGVPYQIVDLGETEVPDDMLEEFLKDLEPRFNAATYDLLTNNCNNFSEELSQLLLGVSIPAHITSLPAEVMATPFGKMILPMIQPAMQQQLGTATASGFGSSPVTTTAAAVATSATPSKPAELAACVTTASSSTPAGTIAAAAATVAATEKVMEGEEPLKSSQQSAAETATDRKAAAAAISKAHFENVVQQEFLKVLAEGVLDKNAAGIEALQRAMAAVKAMRLPLAA